MSQIKIIIADENGDYIIPLQLKFITEFFNKIDLEVITDPIYFEQAFQKPQYAEILIISDTLYNHTIQKHNIAHVFVMTEKKDEVETGELNVNRLYKYTSIKEIYNEIVGKSAAVLESGMTGKKETPIVLVTSASGGVGKTTIAMGISACLAQNFKRVLYINASRLQNFQYLLDNQTALASQDVYSKLSTRSTNIYEDIKHVIRKEVFYYLPAFRNSLMSLGVECGIYEALAVSAQKSGDYDFIIIDAESTFDEHKTKLIDIANKVIVVMDQSITAVNDTNSLLYNINGVSSEKYMFICNKFEQKKYNALIMPDLRFTINEYVENYKAYEQIKISELIRIQGMQRIAFLII